MPSPPGKGKGVMPSGSGADSQVPPKEGLLDKSMQSMLELSSSDDSDTISIRGESAPNKKGLKRRKTSAPEMGDATDDADPLEQLSRIGLALENVLSKQRVKLTSSGVDKVKEMMAECRIICTRLVRDNAYLKGKLDERTASNNVLEDIKKTQDNLAKQVATAKPISYADIASRYAPAKVSLPGKKEVLPTNQDNKRTVLVYPKDKSESNSSLATEALVKMCVNPQKMGLRIKRISKIRNNGVAIEVLDDASLEKLKSEPKLKACVEIAQPRKKRPKVLIYDVPSDIKDVELAGMLSIQNSDLPAAEELQSEFKPIFRTGPRNQPVTNWVVEVSARVRNSLIRTGRVFLGWTSSRVVDHQIVSRCFKCQKFGHLAKNCAAKAETCGHCAATGHEAKACPDKDNKNKIKCANCAFRVSKGKSCPINHSATDRNCPTYIAEIERLVAQTDYGC